MVNNLIIFIRLFFFSILLIYRETSPFLEIEYNSDLFSTIVFRYHTATQVYLLGKYEDSKKFDYKEDQRSLYFYYDYHLHQLRFTTDATSSLDQHNLVNGLDLKSILQSF